MAQSRPTDKPTSGALDETRKAGGKLAESVRESAHDAAEKVTSEASRAAGNAQNTAAQEVKDVASALRTAAGELRDGSPQDRAFSHMADSLADLSDTLRDKDMREMMGSLNGFARRNPLVFLGSAALVGFAATRLVKASGEDASHGGYAQSAQSIPGQPTATRPVAGQSATTPSPASPRNDGLSGGPSTPPPASPLGDPDRGA